jgi:hypothetical protein
MHRLGLEAAIPVFDKVETAPQTQMPVRLGAAQTLVWND